MTSPETSPVVATRAWLLTGFLALFVLLLAFGQADLPLGGLLVSVIGAAGLLLRWSRAPGLMLLVLSVLLLEIPGGPLSRLSADRFLADPLRELASALGNLTRPSRDSRLGTDLLRELIVCAAAVVYLGAQFRLLRPLAARGAEVMPSLPELGGLLGGAAAAALAGLMIWSLLPADSRGLGDLPPPANWAGNAVNQHPDVGPALAVPAAAWRVGFLAWSIAVLGLSAVAVAGALEWRCLSAAEAAVFLNDIGWQETRREQQRLANWRKDA